MSDIDKATTAQAFTRSMIELMFEKWAVEGKLRKRREDIAFLAKRFYPDSTQEGD